VPLLASAFLLNSLGSAADDAKTAWKPVLPIHEFNPLVDQAYQALREPLGKLSRGRLKDDERRRIAEPARGLALFIAAYAQSTKTEGEEARRLAAVRDVALLLERALNDGDLAAARKLWVELPDARATEQTKTAPVSLSDVDGREDVVRASMFLVRPPSRGGLGLESALNNLARTSGAVKWEDAARLGYQVTAMAQMDQSAAPLKKEGDKDPKDWLRVTDALREAGLDLAKAATMKDAAGVRQAAGRVNASCLGCHRVFRDN
jgi:hypothetical protein